MVTIRRNLISKAYGITDHMPADKVTDILFPKAERYEDISRTDDEGNPIYGQCIKNQYVSIDWIKELIKSEGWKNVGKEKAVYEYFVDCDSIMKPNLVNYQDNEVELYSVASGDMQFDFDDLQDEIIEEIKNAFIKTSADKRSYHWFEYSWSHCKEHDLCGCHVRIFVRLNLKTKVEWGFYYHHFLNCLLLNIKKKYRDEVIKHIDWSCCSVTRGFAIPYNDGGVLIGNTFDEEKINGFKTEDELDSAFKYVNGFWIDEIFEHYMKKFVNPNKRKELEELGLVAYTGEWNNTYKMEGDWEFDENHCLVSGEEYNYNWRLSLVTTLMGVFNQDKEIVRAICSVIYKYIKPYKNHTYEEMIGNELEKKIFRRANFELEPSHQMIKELKDNWGLNIKISPHIS